MTITIEGFSVVVKKERIVDLLDDGTIVPPNSTGIADDYIWRCSFMSESDAKQFVRVLETNDFNASTGPDSDAVLISEFSEEVYPYCEWIQTAKWEKAVLAWKVGTDPKKLIAREGFDPKVGSGLTFHDPANMDDLEFLREENNVEVYFNKKIGKEVYIGRTSKSPDVVFKRASEKIVENFRTAGEPPVQGKTADEVREAIAELQTLLEKDPEWWQALFFHGKGLIALADHEGAYASLSKAYELEPEVEAIPRELGGVCLELGKFDEAVSIGERAVSIQPDDAGSLGNLALIYLMARKLPESRKAIDAAMKLDPGDEINNMLVKLIGEVESGLRPQPENMAELNRVATKVKPRKKRWWEFWK